MKNSRQLQRSVRSDEIPELQLHARASGGKASTPITALRNHIQSGPEAAVISGGEHREPYREVVVMIPEPHGLDGQDWSGSHISCFSFVSIISGQDLCAEARIAKGRNRARESSLQKDRAPTKKETKRQTSPGKLRG